MVGSVCYGMCQLDAVILVSISLVAENSCKFLGRRMGCRIGAFDAVVIGDLSGFLVNLNSNVGGLKITPYTSAGDSWNCTGVVAD